MSVDCCYLLLLFIYVFVSVFSNVSVSGVSAVVPVADADTGSKRVALIHRIPMGHRIQPSRQTPQRGAAASGQRCTDSGQCPSADSFSERETSTTAECRVSPQRLSEPTTGINPPSPLPLRPTAREERSSLHRHCRVTTGRCTPRRENNAALLATTHLRNYQFIKQIN